MISSGYELKSDEKWTLENVIGKIASKYLIYRIRRNDETGKENQSPA